MVEVKKVNTYTGHKGAVYTIERGPEPNIFYSSGADGQIIEWDLENPENGRLIAIIPSSVYAMKFIPMLNTLIIGQNHEGIHLLDVAEKSELGSLKMTDSQIFAIDLFGDSMLVGTGDGELVQIGINDMQIRNSNKLSDMSLRSIAVAKEGKELVASFSDNAFRILDPRSFKVKHTIEAHKSSVFSAVYTPNGEHLITASRDAHLKFWNTQDGYSFDEEIVAHMYAINHLSFHPNGKYFATASMDKTIKIWDLEKRKLLKVIDKARHEGHLTSVNRLFWTEYSDLLLSASDDRSVSVWDINIVQ